MQQLLRQFRILRVLPVRRHKGDERQLPRANVILVGQAFRLMLIILREKSLFQESPQLIGRLPPRYDQFGNFLRHVDEAKLPRHFKQREIRLVRNAAQLVADGEHGFPTDEQHHPGQILMNALPEQKLQLR